MNNLVASPRLTQHSQSSDTEMTSHPFSYKGHKFHFRCSQNALVSFLDAHKLECHICRCELQAKSLEVILKDLLPPLG